MSMKKAIAADEVLPADYTLIYIVGLLLVVFYLVIMYILSSDENDRKRKIKNINNPYRK
jgi:hypothetical protein